MEQSKAGQALTLKELQDLNHSLSQQLNAIRAEFEKLEQFASDRRINIYMQIYIAAVQGGQKNPAHLAKQGLEDFEKQFGG